MDRIWERLENFLRQNAPEIYDGLALGASEQEIVEVEQSCGFQFPPDLRQSYLRHDGQMPGLMNTCNAGAGGEFIPGYFALMSMSRILREWEGNNEPGAISDEKIHDEEITDPRVKRVYLDRAWIAFASDIGGNALCLDFDPMPGGTIGQVILFDHEDAMRIWLAPNFEAWLNRVVSDLEAGRLIWNEELEGYDYPEDTGEAS